MAKKAAILIKTLDDCWLIEVGGMIGKLAASGRMQCNDKGSEESNEGVL
jgi:hypothetical protein